MEAPANRDLLWLASMLGSIEPQCKAERVRHRTDTVFLLTMGGRVIAMQTGFATMEAAYGRPSNSANIMMKNSMDLFLGIFVYYFAGFLITFGDPPLIIEENGFDFALWFLHFSYATTAATINSGALAGRVSFLAYLVLSMVLTGVIYPVGVQWVWGGGWLSELGYIDFAGSSLVHMTGAIGALVAVSLCGPRIGKYPDYRAWTGIWKYVFVERNESEWYQHPVAEIEKAVFTPIKPCNNPVQLLFGTFLLLVGFLAFNPASTLATTFNQDLVSARTTVTTLISAAAGALSSIVWSVIEKRGVKLKVPEMTNSVLGGLVASCACCHVVPPLLMIPVGFVGGILATATAILMERRQLDDTVGAVSVHGPPAIWGVLSVALFAQPHCQSDVRGLFFGGGEDAWILLLVQLCGVFSLGAFAGTATYLCVLLVDLVIGFRCNRAHELIGLDFTEHGIDDGALKYERKEHLLTHSPVRDCLVERVKSRVVSPIKSYAADPDAAAAEAETSPTAATPTANSPAATPQAEQRAEPTAPAAEVEKPPVSTDIAAEKAVASPIPPSRPTKQDPISAKEREALEKEVLAVKNDVKQLTSTLSYLVKGFKGEDISKGSNVVGTTMDARHSRENREHALQELLQEAEALATLANARGS
mmetsp:Transcript_51426/g.148397  ORF Transcript_51426/g.148397 Transcript_51426/m.148397 type:complete len:646 (-) Transcript_51426:221-2158(-)